MKNLLNKISLFFLSFLVLASSYLTILAPSVQAQSTWYNQNPFEWYIKVYDQDTSPPNEIFGERYTAAQVQWIIYGLTSYAFNLPYTLLGMNPSPNICLAGVFSGTIIVEDCLGRPLTDFIEAVITKLKDFKIIVSEPTQPNTASIWNKIFNEDRPISGIAYVRNIIRKLNPVSTVNAQSYGFNNLTIISDLWKTVRDVAYLLLVIAIVAIAFMIMFKIKISPQATISIQSALPKIVVSLILITFSYAIAGFMIDIMYVLMGLFSVSFAGLPYVGIKLPSTVFAVINGGSLGGGALVMIGYFWLYLVLYLLATLLVVLSALLNLNFASGLFGIILFVFIILVFIILLIDFFRILFALFKALAGFYFAVIVGPIQILAGVLPTSPNAFGNWLKSIVSKLAVFPATGILYYFSFIFLLKSLVISSVGILNIPTNIIDKINTILGTVGLRLDLGVSIPYTNLWGPPMLGNGATASSIAFILMSLTCIMLIPKVNKAIESALAGRPFDMESAVSESTKAPRGLVSSGVGYVGEYNELKYKASYGANKKAGRLAAASQALQQILRM